MSTKKKTSYTNEFKFKVALAAVRERNTIGELSIEYNVASSLISKWKKQLLENGGVAFAVDSKPPVLDAREKQLYEQLGRQAMEINYLKKFADKYQ
jgi:transposase